MGTDDVGQVPPMLDRLLHDLTSHDGPTVTTTVAVASWAYDEIVRLRREVTEMEASMDAEMEANHG